MKILRKQALWDASLIKKLYFEAETVRVYKNFCEKCDAAENREEVNKLFEAYIKQVDQLRDRYVDDSWEQKDLFQQNILKTKIEETIKQFLEETKE